VGDWDAFEIDNPSRPVAHNHVTRILNDCVLLEDYQGNDWHYGHSFTIYDAARNLWHQSWVTKRGELLVIEGKIENGEMVGWSDEDLTALTNTLPSAARNIAAFVVPGTKKLRVYFQAGPNDHIFQLAST
jgi:hypothetical protein